MSIFHAIFKEIERFFLRPIKYRGGQNFLLLEGD